MIHSLCGWVYQILEWLACSTIPYYKIYQAVYGTGETYAVPTFGALPVYETVQQDSGYTLLVDYVDPFLGKRVGGGPPTTKKRKKETQNKKIKKKKKRNEKKKKKKKKKKE